MSNAELAPLPAALLAQVPRPLPPWARRRSLIVLLFAAGGTCWFTGVFLLREAGAMALIPFGIGSVFIAIGWLSRAKRGLLATGDGTGAGLVTEVWSAKGTFCVAYAFETPRGRFTGTGAWQSSIVVQDFGLRPAQGDTVFVVYDSQNPTRNAVWGFSLPPGAPRRELHWADKPVPRWLWVALVVGAVGAVVAVVARTFLRF